MSAGGQAVGVVRQIPLLIILITASLIASAEAYEWVEQKGEVYKSIEVLEFKLPGGFDEHGNYVIRYLIVPPEGENASGPFIRYSMAAIKIWNSSIRAYSEKCEALKKLILRAYVKGVNDTQEYDVIVEAGGLLQLKAGIYKVHEAGKPPRAMIDITYYRTWLKEMDEFIILVLSHEIGHSFRIGHTSAFKAERLLDFRGIPISHESPVGGYKEGAAGYPDSYILETLCRIFTPIIRSGSAPLSTRMMFEHRSENYSAAPGLIQVYRHFEGEKFLRGPFHNVMLRPSWRGYWYSMYLTPFTYLEGEAPAGLYGGDILVDPSLILSCKPWGTIVIHTSKHPWAFRAYNNDTIDVVIGYEIKKAAYLKVYQLRVSYGEKVPSILGPEKERTCVGESGCIPEEVPLYVYEEDFRELNLSERIGEKTVIVVMDEAECGPGECYDHVEDLGDGRIIMKGVRRDLIVKYDLEKAYRVGLEDAEIITVMGRTYDYDGKTYALRDSEIIAKPVAIVRELDAGSRLVLDSWTAGEWNGTHLILKIDKPIDARPIWRRQHLVAVDSPVGEFRGVGWIDENIKVVVEPAEKIVDLGNGTRLVFMGFEGYGEKAELNVTSPITLKASWSREYRVNVESRFVFNYAEWVREGNGYFIVVKKMHDFGNGTMIRLRSMKAAAPSGELEIEGREASKLLFIEAVREPVNVSIEWDAYYALKLESIAPVNGSSGLFKEGEAWEACADKSIQYDNGTIKLFQHWLVNGERYPERCLRLVVERPMNISAVWKTLYYVSILLSAGEGYAVEPDKMILENGLGEVLELSRPSTFIEKGFWLVREAWYRGMEVSKPGTVLNVAGSGPIILESRLRNVRVEVSDILGLPAPFAEISTPFTDIVRADCLGRATLIAIPPIDVEVAASMLFMRSSTLISQEDLHKKITIPISPYTMIIMLVISAVACLSYKHWRCRRGSS